MKFKSYSAPHIRHHENTRVLMLDAMVAMAFIYGMALFYYGPRVLMLMAASIVAAVISDTLCTLLARRRVNLRDCSAVVSGMLIPLLMPASVDYRVVVTAAVFGIVVAKQPFGGVGHNIFNPAAAGFCFTSISFTDTMFSYPYPQTMLPVFGPMDTPLTTSPAFTLSLGGIPQYDRVEMLLGNYPGPMGATNILVILACLLYLVFRNTVRWEVPVCFFTVAALFAFLFPRGGVGMGFDFAARVELMLFEMMSGCLLLGGAFMLGDPVTTPKRDWSKIAFACTAGIVVMLFRRWGGFEETLPFAVLLMNCTVWGFDMLGERFASAVRRRNLTT